ncbi:MAG: ATP-binding protein, partial [Gammaproteobacteria bacterium]
LWPRSLFGRLMLVLIAGLIVAQIIATFLSLHERDQALVHFSDQQWVQRNVDAVRLIESLPVSERAQVAGILTSPRLTVTRETAADNPAGALQPDADAAGFQSQLRRQLPNHVVHGYMLHVPVPEQARSASFEVGYRTRSVTQVQLSDGGWVRFDFLRPLQLAGWPYPLLVDILVLLIAVIVLSLIAVRWMTRPLSALSAAADELGRDIRRAPVPETGPAEVRHAARAFNEMQTRLVRYVEDRTRLLTAISHDLKTPITRLRLRAELLEDETLKGKLVRDLQDMENMTNATLEFLRGLEVHEPSQPIDLMALLESIQADAVETGQPVSLQGHIQRAFNGRPQALRRCLENLVGNAVRYGKRADISVEDNDTAVTIHVRDAGPGIPENQLEKVFEPYYRLEEARSQAGGGTGLGLGIARNVALLHGGTLSLRNHPEGGLEAVLTLPRSKNGEV